MVRFARAGEKLTLLNGQVLDLEPDLLLVCDEKKPLGLAGIMGGEHSGIGDDTTRAAGRRVLEPGRHPGAVAAPRLRQRCRLPLRARCRFRRLRERGRARDAADPRHLRRARRTVVGDVRRAARARSRARAPRARQRACSASTSPTTTIAHCSAGSASRHARDGDDFLVTPPSYRFDLAIEEDFVEEIARLTATTRYRRPRAHVQSMLPDPRRLVRRRGVKRRLVARDWQEAITFSFVSSATGGGAVPGRDRSARRSRAESDRQPSRRDAHHALPAACSTCCAPISRASRSACACSKSGRCFLRAAQGYDQPMRLGGLAYGAALPEQWGVAKRAVDFFDVKGDLEALVAPRTLATDAAAPSGAASRPLGARAGRRRGVGWLGEMHPRIARQFELPRAPVVFELDLAAAARAARCRRRRPVSQAADRPPRYGRGRRRSVAARGRAGGAGSRQAAACRCALRLFDVYRGAGMTPGKKSLAILVLMQDTERTLTDAEIDATMAAAAAGARQMRFGATLRH